MSIVLSPLTEPFTEKRLGYFTVSNCTPSEFVTEIERVTGDRPTRGVADWGWALWVQCPAPDFDS